MNKNNQKILEGWSVKKLGETCFFFNGKAHENCVDENGKYVLINSKFISSNGQVCKRVNACLFPLIENDITIVMSDVPNGKAIAKCFLVNEADKYTLNQRIGCLRTKQAIPQYLVNIISRNKYFLKFDDGINQTNLRKDQILNCPLLLPPLPEQEKIALVLGTWDEAIEKLSGLIEQKKLLKKGLMQKLLTGKTRLPGFTQPWKEVKLGEIGTTYTGLSGKNKDNFGRGSYFIPYMNIYQNNHINPQQLEQVKVDEGEKQNTVKYGDIFFTTSSETPEEVGFASVLLFNPERNIYLNSFCFGYRLNNFKSLLPEYASFLFRSIHARKIMYKLAQGATRFNLSKNELMKEKIYIPSDISEQQAIADVLSTADDEINLLNQKLEALKTQKKGLMQKLLIGQIRVKVN